MTVIEHRSNEARAQFLRAWYQATKYTALRFGAL
jgi:hypothetical protein